MEKKYIFIHHKFGILKIFKRIKKMVIHRKFSGSYLKINNLCIGFFYNSIKKQPYFKKNEHPICNRKK